MAIDHRYNTLPGRRPCHRLSGCAWRTTMSPIPPFPAGTLPFQRADGSDTRMWLGPAGLQHADRQVRTWRAMLHKQRACDAAWDWRLEVETAAADRSHIVLAACERS